MVPALSTIKVRVIVIPLLLLMNSLAIIVGKLDILLVIVACLSKVAHLISKLRLLVKVLARNLQERRCSTPRRVGCII